MWLEAAPCEIMGRMSVAELKTLVKRPDVVEVWDTTASDPRLLVYLKAGSAMGDTST